MDYTPFGKWLAVHKEVEFPYHDLLRVLKTGICKGRAYNQKGTVNSGLKVL